MTKHQNLTQALTALRQAHRFCICAESCVQESIADLSFTEQEEDFEALRLVQLIDLIQDMQVKLTQTALKTAEELTRYEDTDARDVIKAIDADLRDKTLRA